MLRLMLLRHAKSDWPDGVADHDRPLAERGRRDAPLVAAAMAARGLVPDFALVSTARRTRETWDLVAPGFGAVEMRLEPSIYEAKPAAILKVIRAVGDDAGRLLVVGHNPGMERLALQLAETTADFPAITQKYPTSALAVIEFDAGDWREVEPGQGRLTLFVTPATLDGVGRSD